MHVTYMSMPFHAIPTFTISSFIIYRAVTLKSAIYHCTTHAAILTRNFWPLYYLSFKLPLLITPLISSNFWPLYYLSFKLPLLITPLISSNFWPFVLGIPCSVLLCVLEQPRVYNSSTRD
jgi:hypothetical protein